MRNTSEEVLVDPLPHRQPDIALAALGAVISCTNLVICEVKYMMTSNMGVSTIGAEGLKPPQ